MEAKVAETTTSASDTRTAKLRGLQLEMLGIIQEFARLCEKHNLKYYLYGGTLLGAIRHKGFIPWDDDVDIVMPRQDYERFAKVCKTELPEHLFYQNCYIEKEFPLFFAKIRKNNTYVEEDKWFGNKMHHGIFIDILPLDFFPKSERLGMRLLKMYYFLHRVCARPNPKTKNAIKIFSFKLLKRLPIGLVYRLRAFVPAVCNILGDKNLYCSFGSHYRPLRKRVFREEWFGAGVPVEFEGTYFNAPVRWEAYLEHLFGPSYMSLPPEDQRRIHYDITKCRLSTLNHSGL